MTVSALHHYTLRCRADDLKPLFNFYTMVLGLREGSRPDFDVAGYWLYSGDHPIVHIFEVPEKTGIDTGSLDHISFRAHDLPGTRTHLASMGIPFEEVPVPQRPLHQVFIRDPKGLKVELIFSTLEGACDA
jgi:catechol 2,3-dioxygenase-like lactoylglutathione lyase family enzyme